MTNTFDPSSGHNGIKHRQAPAPARVELCPSACAADALLAQAAAFIEAVDDARYARPSRVLRDGTIGKHFRHVADHFAAALATLERPDAAIDYDHRRRDVPMETDRRAALEAIGALRAALGRATTRASAASVCVRVMLAADGNTFDFASTLGRELAFATHHAVHHHAMIKAIAEEMGLPTPDGFGMAPSTLNSMRAPESSPPWQGARR